MQVNAISAGAVSRGNNVSFNGQWKKRAVYNAADFHIYNKNEYIPDKNETAYDISNAWKKETGLYPIDWVKKVNPYNQIKKIPYGGEIETEYSIKGKKYMPLDVLKASAQQKLEKMEKEYKADNESQRLVTLIDLAEISSMDDDKKAAKDYESEIVKIYVNQNSLRLKKAVASKMNEYKENWGSAVWAKDVYSSGSKNLYEDSDKMIKEYNA